MVRENDYTVSIVDLDNIIVVDSRTVPNASIEKHNHIPCDGCFAYDANEMANHWMSDFNVYAICSVSFLFLFYSLDAKSLICKFLI